MYYGGIHYWAKCKDKVRIMDNTACTTKLWNSCPINNSNYILRFTIMSELSTVGTGP